MNLRPVGTPPVTIDEVMGTAGEFLNVAFAEVARNERRKRSAGNNQKAFPPFGFWLAPLIGRFPLEWVPSQACHRGLVRWWTRRRDRLCAELVQMRWRARPANHFLRQVPGRAPRPITVPAFEDSLISLALCWAFSRCLTHLLPECAHGWRPGRGTGTAVRAWLLEARKGSLWAGEVDVCQFFNRIPREPLWALLGRYMDRPTLNVIQSMAEAASTTGVGLGQGYAHVPQLASLYLAPALRAAGVVTALYGDNMLVVGRSQDDTRARLDRLTFHIQRLGLEVHVGVPRSCEQADFLSICLRRAEDAGLTPALSADCIDRLESLPPEARERRRAGLSDYLENVRRTCSLPG